MEFVLSGMTTEKLQTAFRIHISCHDFNCNKSKTFYCSYLFLQEIQVIIHTCNKNNT